MRIGVRLAISGLVLASIVVTAVGANVLWFRTATATSRMLAATINAQIVSAVADAAHHDRRRSAIRAHRDPHLVSAERS